MGMSHDHLDWPRLSYREQFKEGHEEADRGNDRKTDKTEIEKMTNYKYMGNTTAMNNRTRQELSIRIKAGWSFLKHREKSLWTGTLP